ncbi:MAG: hypothetical protein P8L71_02700 [Flavobacteriales bacterium]|nr:hypothetical protein [Flavobacteriales bacterium]
MRKSISLVCLLFLGFMAFSQEEQHWSDMMTDPSVNFYEVQAAFNEYWEGKGIEKGKGYKQFKRWEYFMEQRVYPSGERFSSMASWDALSDERRNMPVNAERQAGVWSYFGNTSVPTSGGGAGRINMVRVDPANSNVYFACAPGGGLWRSDNAGGSWSLLNTDLLASIGVTDIAIDHTDSDVLYIATGDGDAGDTYSLGVLKSSDGGGTWNATGLNWNVTQTRRINRLLMHPTDSQMLVAATSNGMYITTDGGGSWTQTLSGNYKDVEFRPGTPSTIYATGNSDDFYRSTDTGANWSQVGTGLPTSGVNRLAIAVSADNPNVVYAVAGASAGSGFYGFYRSIDGGTSFATMATSPNLLGWDAAGGDTGGQSWYDLAIAVNPMDADEVYVGGVNVWKTTDGGTAWSCTGHWYGAGGLPYVHADNHGFHFIPGTSTLLVGGDGGVFRTSDNGSSFVDLSSNLEVAQIYRLGVSQTNQNVVITGWQDNGTNLKEGADWSRVIGGDGFESAVDPTNGDIMYGALYYGQIFKSTNGGGSFNTIVNSGGTGVNENGAWLTPYILDPSDPNTMYVGKSTVYKSTDGGASFNALGGIAGGNIGGLEVSKSNANYIFASKGSTLYRSTDGTNFAALSGLPNLTITYICIDPANENNVWVTLSGFSNGNKVYYSADGGDSWSNYSDGLPNIPANTIVYHEGSNDALYVGTDAGVYYRDATFGAWQPYKDGLPNVVVSELEIHYASNTIVASTYGRGVWNAPLFTLPAIDAGLVSVEAPTGTQCLPDVTPSLTIGNFGNDDVTAVTITYGVSGGTLSTYNWTGLLATGETETITLPTYNDGLGAFVFEANVTEVNGSVGDDNAINNSSTSNYFVSGGTNTVDLALTTDCWGNESSWDVVDADGNIIFSGAGYGNQTTFNEVLCLADGCFTFNMYDSYGDGLNGTAFGCGTDGNYVLTDEMGNVLVQMDVVNFGNVASHVFCLGGGTPGCIDDTACNYDPAATVSDGSCTFPGCTDAAACNYNASAGCDDGSCDLVSCVGCTDPVADNYDPAATIDDGSCIYTCVSLTLTILTDNYPAETTWNITDDGDNIVASGGPYAAGQTTYVETICLDEACYTLNFFDSFGDGMQYNGVVGSYLLEDPDGNVLAQIVDGSNFGSEANDPFCILADPVNGCTDATACNYDPAATVDDGSCDLPDGCTDNAACNYDASASCDDGSCEFLSCAGCTNATACNYDASATIDDGSCDLPDGCTDNTACNFDASASCDDGSCDYGSVYYVDSDGDGYGDGAPVTLCAPTTGYSDNDLDCDDDNGDMYPGAPSTQNGIDNDCNGVVDPDEEELSCMGDFNGDGNRDVADLLMVLGDFGCNDGCIADMSGDGYVDTQDMLAFLGIFGVPCE